MYTHTCAGYCDCLSVQVLGNLPIHTGQDVALGEEAALFCRASVDNILDGKLRTNRGCVARQNALRKISHHQRGTADHVIKCGKSRGRGGGQLASWRVFGHASAGVYLNLTRGSASPRPMPPFRAPSVEDSDIGDS